jgi:F-type H+-transporting ATPase subunit gamma
MQALEGLRRQIDTAEDLHNLVRTMKSLSAASIRHYERAAEAVQGYAGTVELGLQAVLRRRAVRIEAAEPEGRATGVVVFGSDYGLCGRFNRAAVDRVWEYFDASGADLAATRRIAVGVRAAARLEASGVPAEAVLRLPGSVGGVVETAYDLIARVDRWTGEGVDRVLLAHNRRRHQTLAVPTMRQLLPPDPDWLRRLRDRPWDSRSLPAFRADAERLFAGLMRQHLFVTVFRATAESLASEHASRVASMQAAERNVEEHVEELRASYRQRRQQSITEELMDIVAGFEALGGDPDEHPDARA